MAISPDQQATLQLLLERGQSYDDLARLLDQGTDEVRARARAALTELAGADPDRNVALTDFLLGQADPIGRADASRHLREDPADRELAAELCEALRAMYPAAELPRLPGEPRPAGRRRRLPRGAKPEGEAPPRRSPFAGLTQSQTRMIAIAGVAGVLLLAVVLGISGAFGGGDEDSSAATTATPTTAAADQEVQRVPLAPVDGGDATGEAVFGLATGDQPFVELSIEGLDPAPSGQTYVVWLMLTPDQGYPLSPIAVSENGTFQNRFSVPSAVLPIVARVQFVDVSIAPVKAIRDLVRDAIESTALVIKEPGKVVLRGEIPKAAGQDGSGSGAQGGGN